MYLCRKTESTLPFRLPSGTRNLTTASTSFVKPMASISSTQQFEEEEKSGITQFNHLANTLIKYGKPAPQLKDEENSEKRI